MTVEIAPWLSASRWETVPIRYVARLGSGHTPSRQRPEYWEDCKVPWVTLADVGQLRDGTVNVISKTAELISPLGLANSSAVRHPAGTVILSRTASVGFSAILGADMATSQDFATWTCGAKLDNRYLLHALRAMVPDLRRLAMGSTHKTIYMPDIAGLRIPLPPLDEQRQIADILDAETARIDELLRLRALQRDLLKERRALLLESKVIEARSVSMKIAHVLKLLRDGSHQPPPRVDRGVPLLTARNVATGVLQLTPQDTHVSVDDADSLERSFKVQSGDVLMSVKGTIGSVALVPEDFPRVVLDRNVAILRARTDIVTARWLIYVLRTREVQDQIRVSVSAAAQPGLPLGVIAGLRVRIPSLEEQRILTEELTSSHAESDLLMRTLRRQSELLLERRQALITAAVTGQFDVTTARGADLS